MQLGKLLTDTHSGSINEANIKTNLCGCVHMWKWNKWIFVKYSKWFSWDSIVNDPSLKSCDIVICIALIMWVMLESKTSLNVSDPKQVPNKYLVKKKKRQKWINI